MKNSITFTFLLFISIKMVNAQSTSNDKIAVYQLMMRIFSNQNTTNVYNGTLKQNGVGKFKDINSNALQSLKRLGISHVWYTGIIEHATMTDYSKNGIAPDHPQVVKGIAGSPYAIKDYYDVNPDYADSVPDRIKEFENLVKRTHENELKVIIDFIPNHLSRQYKSDQKPENIRDFGELDDINAEFNNQNNFYYIQNQSFKVPKEANPPVKFKDSYIENPAKVSGNDVFSSSPSINDWYETIKLNYGVNYLDNRKKQFEPIPSTWYKMKDILAYWTKKGIDGFRCDMAEMVPVEFWGWVIPQIKTLNPDVIFIAEIYNPSEYKNYIYNGKFDYLYDKVGLYDALRRLIEGRGNANDITKVWQNESGEFSNKMLRFLENHDEQRITSEEFGKNPESALAAMMLSATLHSGPIMVYYGQEIGVKPTKAEGFQGNDGRTTIFDYWGLEELQAWIKNGSFDETKLNTKQKNIREFYTKTLKFAQEHLAVSKGEFYDLQYLNNKNYNTAKQYSYLRYFDDKILLFSFNFDKNNDVATNVFLPEEILSKVLNIAKDKEIVFKEIFNKKETQKSTIYNVSEKSSDGLTLKIPANSFKIYQITKP